MTIEGTPMRLLAFILLTIYSVSVIAHSVAPAPMCTKPIKPRKFYSVIDEQKYKRNLAEYSICLGQTILEQDAAIRIHQKAKQNSLMELKQLPNNKSGDEDIIPCLEC